MHASSECRDAFWVLALFRYVTNRTCHVNKHRAASDVHELAARGTQVDRRNTVLLRATDTRIKTDNICCVDKAVYAVLCTRHRLTSLKADVIFLVTRTILSYSAWIKTKYSRKRIPNRGGNNFFFSGNLGICLKTFCKIFHPRFKSPCNTSISA